MKKRKEEKNMKALSYINGSGKEIEEGRAYHFGEIWDGDGDGKRLLKDGCLYTYSEGEEIRIDFEVIQYSEDVLEALVEVTCIA